MEEEMLRLIANPHRLKPEKECVEIKPSLETKIHCLLRDVYPDLYITDMFIGSVCKCIRHCAYQETIDSVVGELVDIVILHAIH